MSLCTLFLWSAWKAHDHASKPDKIKKPQGNLHEAGYQQCVKKSYPSNTTEFPKHKRCKHRKPCSTSFLLSFTLPEFILAAPGEISYQILVKRKYGNNLDVIFVCWKWAIVFDKSQPSGAWLPQIQNKLWQTLCQAVETKAGCCQWFVDQFCGNLMLMVVCAARNSETNIASQKVFPVTFDPGITWIQIRGK